MEWVLKDFHYASFRGVQEGERGNSEAPLTVILGASQQAL